MMSPHSFHLGAKTARLAFNAVACNPFRQSRAYSSSYDANKSLRWLGNPTRPIAHWCESCVIAGVLDRQAGDAPACSQQCDSGVNAVTTRRLGFQNHHIAVKRSSHPFTTKHAHEPLNITGEYKI